jgi:hypothetical protein
MQMTAKVDHGAGGDKLPDGVLTNLAAERGLLGYYLARPDRQTEVLHLSDSLFSDARHREILSTLKAAAVRGEPVDMVPVVDALHKAGAGVPADYVAQLVEDGAPTPAPHERILRECAQRRWLDTVVRTLGRAIRDPQEDIDAVAAEVRAALEAGFDSGCRTPSLLESNREDRWLPRPLSTLGVGTNEPPWIWHGYLAPGALTLLIGLWKGGKTTLVAHLLRALDPSGPGGTFAGGTVQPGRVLVVTEEGSQLWATRRDKLGLQDHVDVICRPFFSRPTRGEWEAFLKSLALRIRTVGYSLVIFDSIANLWSVEDENAAGEVTAAITPLRALADLGPAVLLLHHPSKNDASEGRASRGSGALPAAVDILLELRRRHPERPTDCRRVLQAFSRFTDTPAEVVLDYAPDEGYTVVGTKADATAADRAKVIRALLGQGPKANRVEELLEQWPKDAETPKPGERTLRSDLNALCERGELSRTGSGCKNDPYRYWL